MNMNNEFLRGISLEENMFEGETPDETKFCDLDGNEVNVYVNE